MNNVSHAQSPINGSFWFVRRWNRVCRQSVLSVMDDFGFLVPVRVEQAGVFYG